MPATPYMPDSARAAMPQSALQPLPPYLREDFAQSLDRSRPHELLVKTHKGKPVDPSRCGNLQYRYTDTGETVTVPNIWYNQTFEMRMSWWSFELQRRIEVLAAARKDLALAEACTAPFFRGEKTAKVVQSMRWHVQDLERMLAEVQCVHDDVANGKRLV
jgi:hypothetical protein